MNETPHRILVVDDEPSITEFVSYALKKEGFFTDVVDNGEDALALATKNPYDLFVLDIMLPGMDGYELCRRLRSKTTVPVLFLSARDTELDKVVGLEIGGDDYLAKPFSYSELLGRVKALLRRYQVYRGKADDRKQIKNRVLESSGIRINRDFNEVSVNGKPVELSNLEYRILLLLMQYPKKIFSAQNLYESVWEEPFFYNCSSTVMVHIRNIREKIEYNPREPKYLKVVWGIGYKIEK